MKRFVSVLLVIIMTLSSVCALADMGQPQGIERLTGQRLTIERLLENLLRGLIGVMDTGEIAFEYTEDENSLKAGLFKDASGYPLLTGSMTEYGMTTGAEVSAEGIVLENGTELMGARWNAVLEVLLQEMGIDGIMNLSRDDGNILLGFANDVVGAISQQAVAVSFEDAMLEGVLARKCRITVNVKQLAEELDAAVPAAINKNLAQLDGLLKRWGKLLNQLFPEIPAELTTADLIAMWKSIGLSEAPFDGIDADITCTYAGDITDRWEIAASACGMSLELKYDGQAILFKLDTGNGVTYSFDSRDLAYISELLISAADGVTEAAISLSDETSRGMREIRFDMDGVRLRKQLVTGLIQAVAENRDKVNALIAKYRSWIALFAPEAAGMTADTAIMALTVMNSGAGQYTGIVEMLGLYRLTSNYIQLHISYPVKNSAAYGEVGATAAPVTEAAGRPVDFLFSNGRYTISFSMDETGVDAEYTNNNYGRGWKLNANTDAAGKTMTATLSGGYIYDVRRNWSITLDADEKGLHIYSVDGDTDIRAVFREDGADINGTIDGSEITGDFTALPGLWKLTLNDGYSIFEGMLRVSENGFALNINLAGDKLSAEGEWGDQIFRLSFKPGNNQFEICVKNDRNTSDISWVFMLNNPYINLSGTLALEPRGLKLRQHTYLYGGTSINVDTEIEASWDPRNPGLYADISGNRTGNIIISYAPGSIMMILNDVLVHISDVTPALSEKKNIAQIALYDAYAYRSGNTTEASIGLDECYERYELVTEESDGKYTMTLSADGEALACLVIDFDPETARRTDKAVNWLTPDMIRMILGIAKPAAADTQTPALPDADSVAPAEAPGEFAVTPVPEGEIGLVFIPVDTPVDKNSSRKDIETVQMRLYELGVLDSDVSVGVLDQNTLQAIADFQKWINLLYGDRLAVIDPENANAVIDESTISWLYNIEY